MARVPSSKLKAKRLAMLKEAAVSRLGAVPYGVIAGDLVEPVVDENEWEALRVAPPRTRSE